MPMSEVTKQDIVAGLKRLELNPPVVAVHSSLRSFGRVQNGPGTVISALLDCFDTVMMPGFQYAASVPPPVNPPPERNGCDYQIHFDHVNPPKPYRVADVPVRPSVGVVAKTFAERTDVLRSNHPWHSWTAWGKHAAELTRDHPWTTTNPPLERLAAMGGWVLLMGVTLASCTAIHRAEEQAGRRPFIRWAMDDRGTIQEVLASGCGKGFGRLAPHCEDLFRRVQINTCNVMAAPITALVERVAPVIRANPELTRCSETCLRCRDIIAGGPVVISGPGKRRPAKVRSQHPL